MNSFGSLYSKKVMEHFKNPLNMGEIKNPDGEATVGNPVCGDVMRMGIKISKIKNPRPRPARRGGQKSKRDEEIIKDIKFQTLGCGAAIATSSVVTQMAKGKSLKEAEKITKKQVIRALGGLPPAKLHCSVLAVDALRKTIANYHQQKK